MRSPFWPKNVKSKYNLLLLDLDGTVVARNESISLPVGLAIRNASRLINTSLASGREKDEVLKFAARLGLSTPQISDGGALITEPSTGHVLWSRPLSVIRSKEIVSRLDSLGHQFIASHPKGVFRSLEEGVHWKLARVSAMDITESEAEAIITSFGKMDDVDTVKVFLPYNGLWAVDFTSVGVSKGSAALELGQLTQMGNANIIAVGDSYNDVPLLQIAALKIVMGNAPQELHQLADFVCPTVDEDGLATAINDFILPLL